MPMLFTWREPNNITWANLLDWTIPSVAQGRSRKSQSGSALAGAYAMLCEHPV